MVVDIQVVGQFLTGISRIFDMITMIKAKKTVSTLSLLSKKTPLQCKPDVLFRRKTDDIEDIAWIACRSVPLPGSGRGFCSRRAAIGERLADTAPALQRSRLRRMARVLIYRNGKKMRT